MLVTGAAEAPPVGTAVVVCTGLQLGVGVDVGVGAGGATQEAPVRCRSAAVPTLNQVRGAMGTGLAQDAGQRLQFEVRITSTP